MKQIKLALLKDGQEVSSIAYDESLNGFGDLDMNATLAELLAFVEKHKLAA